MRTTLSNIRLIPAQALTALPPLADGSRKELESHDLDRVSVQRVPGVVRTVRNRRWK